MKRILKLIPKYRKHKLYSKFYGCLISVFTDKDRIWEWRRWHKKVINFKYVNCLGCSINMEVQEDETYCRCSNCGDAWRKKNDKNNENKKI